MYKIISAPQTSHLAPKKQVNFSPEVNEKENGYIIIDLLKKSDFVWRSDDRRSIELVRLSIQKVDAFFSEGTPVYNKLMAKCLVFLCLRIPISDRGPFLKKANELDSTTEKLSLQKGLPW